MPRKAYQLRISTLTSASVDAAGPCMCQAWRVKPGVSIQLRLLHQRRRLWAEMECSAC
jgi:hypothetical protein